MYAFSNPLRDTLPDSTFALHVRDGVCGQTRILTLSTAAGFADPKKAETCDIDWSVQIWSENDIRCFLKNQKIDLVQRNFCSKMKCQKILDCKIFSDKQDNEIMLEFQALGSRSTTLDPLV